MVRQVNFSNEAQNRAAATISASLYERKALDCTTSLPLIFSLNNLAYLVANNRKIRDLLCVDGGLERLIHILRDVPKNQGTLVRPRSPKDLQPMWKWTTAFQCVVHLCIRGGVNVRERAVEAGIMPILVKVLESYLCYSDALRQERKRQVEERRRADGEAASSAQAAANDAAPHRRTTITANNAGAGASAAALATAREREREREHHERQDVAREEQAAALFPTNFAGAAARTAAAGDNEYGRPEPSSAASATASTSRLLPAHQHASPSGAPVVRLPVSAAQSHAEPSRQAAAMAPMPVDVPTLRAGRPPAPVPAGTSDFEALATASVAEAVRASASHNLEPVLPTRAASSRGPARETPRVTTPLLAAHTADDLGSNSGAESGLEEAEMSGDGADAEDSESAAEAADESENGGRRSASAVEAEERRTPRAARRVLAPLATTTAAAGVSQESRPSSFLESAPRTAQDAPQAVPMSSRSDTWTQTDAARDQQPSSSNATSSTSRSHHHHHGRDRHSTVTHRTRPVLPTTYIAETFDPNDMAFREEEVLLSLQILAYLTKYSHIRALLRFPEMTRASNLYDLDLLWEKASTSQGTPMWQPGQQFHRSIYTIAERYTCRATRRDPNAEFVAGNAKLAPLIQYWAGVVMRNACRKDDREGDEHLGLRQCGNMLCGKWETEPREFAKCRRCKKAKFCSKVCQSTSWQIGHKYWCSSIAEDLENASTTASAGSGTSRAGRGSRSAAAGTTAAGAAQQEGGRGDDDDDEDARRAPAMPDEGAMQQPFNLMTPTTATAGGRGEHVDENDAVVRARSATVRAPHHPRHYHHDDGAGPATAAAQTTHADGAMATPTTATHPAYTVTQASPTTVRRLPSRRASNFNRGNATRLVSEALSSAAASDMSEDEVDRSAHNIQASDGELSEAHEGGHATATERGASSAAGGNAGPPNALRGPPPAPMRTDLAGRPLPPPVIAGTGLDGFAGAQGLVGGGVAALVGDGDGTGGLDDSFGGVGGGVGRFNPGGVDEQAFGRTDIDQITWRGQTPTPDLPDDEDDEDQLLDGTANGTGRLARRRRGPHRRFFATPAASDREETEGEEEEENARRRSDEARTPPMNPRHLLPMGMGMRHASASSTPGSSSGAGPSSGRSASGNDAAAAQSHLRVPPAPSALGPGTAGRRFPASGIGAPSGPRAVSSAGSLRPRSSNNLAIMSDGPSPQYGMGMASSSSATSSPLSARRAASGMMLASSSSHDFLIGGGGGHGAGEGSTGQATSSNGSGGDSLLTSTPTTPSATLSHRQSAQEGLSSQYQSNYHPHRSSTGPGMLGRSSTPAGMSSSTVMSGSSSPLGAYSQQHYQQQGGAWNGNSEDQPTPQVERRDPMAAFRGGAGAGAGAARGSERGASDEEMDLS